METLSIWHGIAIGAAGGAIAGITVWLVEQAQRWWLKRRHKKRVYIWLQANTKDEDGSRYRTTRAIASWTNLPMDRVRHICSVDERIYLSTGPEEDRWSIYDHGDRSVYESRGARVV